MTEHDLKQLTLDGFEMMFNRGQVDYADTAIAVGGVDHQEPLGASFPPHLKKVVATLRTGFPDLHFEVHQIISEGDTVACRSTMTGTHLGVLELGPLAAVEPQGAKVEVSHMHMFRYADGRVADLWHVWDRATLMRQLGAQMPEIRVA
jgi:SnoaL-like polyketide cyclase